MTDLPIATLKPMDHARSGSVPSVGPIVLIDGRVEPQLWVTAWHQAGPIDRRSATLAMSRSDPMVDSGERAAAERWRGRTVTLVQPTLLAGLDSRLMPLLTGRIAQIDMRVDTEHDAVTFDVIDDFNVRLDQPLDPKAFDAPPYDADDNDRAAMRAGQWSVHQPQRMHGLGGGAAETGTASTASVVAVTTASPVHRMPTIGPP